MTKGTMKYIPKELFEELENIKVNCHYNKESDIFRIIAHNSRVAREIKLNLDFGFNKRRKR